MANRLGHYVALEQIYGGYFAFSDLDSYTNKRKDGLRNLIDGIFGNGRSWNPVLSSFRRTYHGPPSLVLKRDSAHDDIIVGVGIARIFMKGVVLAVSSTAEAPLQRVRILLQNQQELIKCGRLSRPYRGILDCSVRIIKTEGVFSLWRGNSVNLIRIIPEQAFKVLYCYVCDRIGVDLRKNRVGYETWLTTLVAHACFYTCVYPLKYARTRLASDIKCVKSGGGRQFNGLFDVYRKTLKSDGFTGIYRGFFIGYIGVMIDNCQNLASGGSPTRSDPSKKFSVDVAMLMGVFSSIVSYPFETVGRRMMMTSGEALKYKNSADAFVQIIKNEGILSLYKGYGAWLLGMVPMFLVMKGLKKLENRPFGTISVVIETK